MSSQIGRGNQMFLYESLLYFLIKRQTSRIGREKKILEKEKKFTCQKIPFWQKMSSMFLCLLFLLKVLIGLCSIFHTQPWTMGLWPTYQLWEESTGWTQQVRSQCWLFHTATRHGKHGVSCWPLSRRALLPHCLDYCQQPALSSADRESMQVRLLNVTGSMLYWD